MTFLLAFVWIVFLAAITTSTALAAVTVAVYAFEQSGLGLDGDAEEARRDALSLSLLSVEWGPALDELNALTVFDAEAWGQR